MKISVIIPIYNAVSYLDRCLDSIIHQTYENLEIILINDGSTDFSGKICEKYKQKDSRIIVIHQKNVGLSSTRNKGKSLSTGDFLLFVDSDDYLPVDAIEKMYNSIKKENADLCICSVANVDLNKKLLYVDKVETGVINNIEEFIENFVITLKTSAWGKLFKKSIIENVFFPDGRIHGEDLVFFSKLNYNDLKMVGCSDIGYFYVKNNNSITTKKGISERSFDEVYCKDFAYQLFSKKFPKYEKHFFVWKFRARRNLLRKMIRYENCSDDRFNKYFDFIRINYQQVKKILKVHEIFEFYVATKITKIYIFLLKRM